MPIQIENVANQGVVFLWLLFSLLFGWSVKQTYTSSKKVLLPRQSAGAGPDSLADAHVYSSLSP